ncbi:MAG: methyltransferase domain-containing protein [Alphaproteobacteria bacterium]|nr:methyltransferase domain-containing protein [Alphaproteobacteria bacterium]
MTNSLRDLTAAEGRSAFGADAANYDAARPPYPDWLYERLSVKPGTQAFEIGPGTGQATGRLLAAGARVTAVEPDARLAEYLLRKFSGGVRTVNAPFEDAMLPDGMFDIGAAATSFHWMEQRPALAKVARLLKPGGMWAMWWNVFGDPDRADPFHEATNTVLNGERGSHGSYSFALDTEGRLADLRSVAALTDIAVEIRKWTLVLTTAEMRRLYASFSQFSSVSLDEKEGILDALAEIAEREFGGRVERNMCTALYTARRV